ncbi:DEAD/DEAH box helicase [Paenibacillus hodogayensis]|uniref:DEAD/DEAH box helicase n=1 Tax=Paenibacillus hodogayensis TaxID=279208 RepID=A0ABV5VX25_9BACL
MTTTFTSLGVRPELCDALQQTGLVSPTPVQAEAIPFAMNGRDVIVQAQTGTGKTLAFLLPLLQDASPRSDRIRSLVLTPTRELAIQIAGEASRLAEATGSSVMSVYGGQDVIAQIHKLGATPDLIIATPGRLLDHVRRGTIDLSRLSALVLDEADQMLHMGFLPEVEEVIRQVPEDRQTMLFSATFPESVRVLSERYMKRPQDIRIQGRRITLDEIRQYVVYTTDRAKRDTLLKLMLENPPFLAVIFCRTKIRAKKLTEYLAAEGLIVDELHGDLTQAKREQVMKRFREAKLQFLVATDVAARGLDVEGVTHVYNYDVPQDPESYIHRIGRTGRAGQQGTAVTLIAPKDEGELREIERAIGSVLERIPLHGSRPQSASAPSAVKPRGGSGGRSGPERKSGRAPAGAERADLSGGGNRRSSGKADAGRQMSTSAAGKPKRTEAASTAKTNFRSKPAGRPAADLSAEPETGGWSRPAVKAHASGGAGRQRGQQPDKPGRRSEAAVPAASAGGKPSGRFSRDNRPERAEAPRVEGRLSAGRGGKSPEAQTPGNWETRKRGTRSGDAKPEGRWANGKRGARSGSTGKGDSHGAWESSPPRKGGSSRSAGKRGPGTGRRR